MSNDYEKLMRKCLSLAKKGKGKTSPNPMVGCVVLDKNDNIISTGYHHKYGENHAERDALLKLKNGEEKGGTLIVNLEPCSHFGKTPPCADLIIERGIKRVVIGCKDNNPKVNGGGIKKLKAANIEIVSGVLENECRKLNEVFFTDVEQKRTFVALKTATTIDGKISSANGNSKWITSEKSRIYGKKLRTYYDAILTSSNTVIADNPTMKHKTKIILDRELKTNFSSNIYKSGKIILVTNKTETVKNIPNNVRIIDCKTKNNEFDLKELLKKLYALGIKSVFVEGGGKLGGSFIREELPDKIYHFIAPKVLNDNSGKSCFDGDNIMKISGCKNFKTENVKQLGDDILVTYTN
ncbi:MAG: bifunctional diaminohydroxyphosphoribosylaminopyrimidine deaminase/5-amino-6-(5-phosphoribosylamino)uracil reductase RibD [Cyanobacteria bacterium RUI128]|nr:bifunctional diaminohydroxyphosphoribosylaminopyrimidine deaminase/5-amino-6-(5-phosphoribosylamino)uracil reductase RibD [Cyanobacteria bacterium RUI128]